MGRVKALYKFIFQDISQVPKLGKIGDMWVFQGTWLIGEFWRDVVVVFFRH